MPARHDTSSTRNAPQVTPLMVWLALAGVSALLLGLWSPWPPSSATVLAWPWVALLGFVVGRLTVLSFEAESNQPHTPVRSVARTWPADDEIYGDPDA